MSWFTSSLTPTVRGLALGMLCWAASAALPPVDTVLPREQVCFTIDTIRLDGIEATAGFACVHWAACSDFVTLQP